MSLLRLFDLFSACRAYHLIKMPLSGGEFINVHTVRFDESLFLPGMFSTAGLACPNSIARSVRKRQAEFFFGRLAAAYALEYACLGEGAGATHISIGPSREPVWPEQALGSISHTIGIAAAVVVAPGQYRGIGIDVEQIVTPDTRAAIAELVLDEAEMRMLRSCRGAMSMDEKLSLVFSAKESLFKAAFPSVGRYFEFSAARLSSLDQLEGRLTLALVEHLASGFSIGDIYELSFCRLDGGEILSACVL